MNTSNKIPSVDFRKDEQPELGFEVLRIEDLFHKIQDKENLEHDSDLPHKLNFFIIFFITEGSSEHFIDFKWYPYQENSMLFIARGQVQAFKFTSQVKGWCLFFTEEFFHEQLLSIDPTIVQRLYNYQLFSPVLTHSAEESGIEEYFKMAFKEYHTPEATGKKDILQALCKAILIKAERIRQTTSIKIEENQYYEIFSEFKRLVESEYTTNRNAAFYAEKLFITYKHLNTICKEMVGKTAKSYIDAYIILEAKRLLVSSNLKTNEISDQLGFDEPTNFVKFFKKETTFTPKQFKSGFRKQDPGDSNIT